ncbi:hypothetical protein HaLaN_31170 [Haematococcus lacustris]|uniref:Uncharacterized protein n=1 Tax=Haematococcus lacustris TaxID=44745 RepID=A0A6A0AIB0_HAELA|nr:hypothetical protein HaLaN_31170 [Haematococcus lacustris]
MPSASVCGQHYPPAAHCGCQLKIARICQSTTQEQEQNCLQTVEAQCALALCSEGGTAPAAQVGEATGITLQ